MAGGIIAGVITLLKPDTTFDWTATKNINPRGRKLDAEALRQMSSEDKDSDTVGEKEQEDVVALSVKEVASLNGRPEEQEILKRSLKRAAWASSIMSFIVLIVSGSDSPARRDHFADCS